MHFVSQQKTIKEIEDQAKQELAFPVVLVPNVVLVDNYDVSFTCTRRTGTLTNVSTLEAFKCGNCQAVQFLDKCNRMTVIRVWARIGGEELGLKLKDSMFENFVEALNAKRNLPDNKRVMLGQSSEMDVSSLVLGARDVTIEYDKTANKIMSFKFTSAPQDQQGNMKPKEKTK